MGRAVWTYDFDKHGGAIGDITVGPKLIPSDAIIVMGAIHVVTAVTSGGSATVAIKMKSSEDILAATAKASLSADALIATVVQPATASTWIFTTAASQLTFTVATAALTAGKIDVCLFYFNSQT